MDIKNNGRRIIIVTRHEGAVNWLKGMGYNDIEVFEQVTEEEVRNNIVIGVLPLHLAALTHSFYSISIPDLPKDKRSHELSAEEMIKYNARLEEYVVFNQSQIDRTKAVLQLGVVIDGVQQLKNTFII